jgi:hypothetical protein
MAWRIRLRGPQGTPAELELPAGGDTTLHELRVLAGKATRVAVHLLVLRAGFPPKPIAFDESTKTAKVSACCETQCYTSPSAPRLKCRLANIFSIRRYPAGSFATATCSSYRARRQQSHPAAAVASCLSLMWVGRMRASGWVHRPAQQLLLTMLRPRVVVPPPHRLQIVLGRSTRTHARLAVVRQCSHLFLMAPTRAHTMNTMYSGGGASI